MRGFLLAARTTFVELSLALHLLLETTLVHLCKSWVEAESTFVHQLHSAPFFATRAMALLESYLFAEITSASLELASSALCTCANGSAHCGGN